MFERSVVQAICSIWPERPPRRPPVIPPLPLPPPPPYPPRNAFFPPLSDRTLCPSPHTNHLLLCEHNCSQEYLADIAKEGNVHYRPSFTPPSPSFSSLHTNASFSSTYASTSSSIGSGISTRLYASARLSPTQPPPIPLPRAISCGGGGGECLRHDDTLGRRQHAAVYVRSMSGHYLPPPVVKKSTRSAVPEYQDPVALAAVCAGSGAMDDESYGVPGEEGGGVV